MDWGAKNSRPQMTSILFSSDLRRSSMFYKDVLGFCVHEEEDGLRVRHSDLELKVYPTNDPVLTSNVGVIVHFERVQDLHSRLDQRDLPELSVLIHDATCQMRFCLRDPDGNTLCFVDKSVAANPGARDLTDQHKERI